MRLSKAIGAGRVLAGLTIFFSGYLSGVACAADRQSTDKVAYPEAGPRVYTADLPIVSKMLGALPEEACTGRILSLSSNAEIVDKLRKQLAEDNISPSDFDFVAEGKLGAEDLLLGLVDGRVARIGFYYPSLTSDDAKQKLLQFEPIQWDHAAKWGLITSTVAQSGTDAPAEPAGGRRRRTAAQAQTAQEPPNKPAQAAAAADDSDPATAQQWFVLTRDRVRIYAELSGGRKVNQIHEFAPTITRRAIVAHKNTQDMYLEPSLVTIGVDARDWYTMHHNLTPAITEAIHQKRLSAGMTKVDAYLALIDYRLGIADNTAKSAERWTWYVDKHRAPAWMAAEALYGVPVMTSPEKRPTVRGTATFRNASVVSFTDH